MSQIEDKRNELITFLNEAGARPDCHEPDEQGIIGAVTGEHLDNAMGEDPGSGELVLTLKSPGHTVKVNVATLLALATYQYRKPFGGVKVIECDDEHLPYGVQAALLNSDVCGCPNCQGDLVETNSDAEGGMMFQHMICVDCCKRYRFDYALVGVATKE